ncbi:MAG: branched-chain amino acid ABC transporter permease [Stellaceae bacterium]
MLKSAATLIVLAIVFVVLPHFYSNQSLLFTMMAFMALAQGLNILYGFTGYLPFGYVGFFGAGAYGAALAVIFGHVPPILAVVIGGLVAVAVGVILGPLLRLSGAYFSIANLAAAEALEQIVGNPDLTAVTKGPYGIKLSSIFAPLLSYYVLLVILLVATAIALWLRRSHIGMALNAIRQDPVSAAAAGVNVVSMRLLAWLLSAFIAGLAGAAYGWHISVFYPDTVFTLQISVFAIVFVLFGGPGTVIGPLVGAAVLYGLYAGIGITIPQYFQFLYGALIVALVLFLPDGLASLISRRGARVL